MRKYVLRMFERQRDDHRTPPHTNSFIAGSKSGQTLRTSVKTHATKTLFNNTHALRVALRSVKHKILLVS